MRSIGPTLKTVSPKVVSEVGIFLGPLGTGTEKLQIGQRGRE